MWYLVKGYTDYVAFLTASNQGLPLKLTDWILTLNVVATGKVSLKLSNTVSAQDGFLHVAV